jgi:hypothetical protein
VPAAGEPAWGSALALMGWPSAIAPGSTLAQLPGSVSAQPGSASCHVAQLIPLINVPGQMHAVLVPSGMSGAIMALACPGATFVA